MNIDKSEQIGRRYSSHRNVNDIKESQQAMDSIKKDNPQDSCGNVSRWDVEDTIPNQQSPKSQQVPHTTDSKNDLKPYHLYLSRWSAIDARKDQRAAVASKRPRAVDFYTGSSYGSDSDSDSSLSGEIMTADEFRAACLFIIDVTLPMTYPDPTAVQRRDQGGGNQGLYAKVSNHIDWKVFAQGPRRVKLSMRMDRFPHTTAWINMQGSEETKMLREIVARYPLEWLDLRYADEGWDIGHGVKVKFHTA